MSVNEESENKEEFVDLTQEEADECVTQYNATVAEAFDNLVVDCPGLMEETNGKFRLQNRKSQTFNKLFVFLWLVAELESDLKELRIYVKKLFIPDPQEVVVMNENGTPRIPVELFCTPKASLPVMNHPQTSTDSSLSQQPRENYPSVPSRVGRYRFKKTPYHFNKI